MSSYHAAAAAARHGRRAASLKMLPPSTIIASGARRYHLGASSSLCPDGPQKMAAASSLVASAPPRLPLGAARMESAASSSGGASSAHHMNEGHRLGLLAAAASLVTAGSVTLASPAASCEASEDPSDKAIQAVAGLADETEEANGANISVEDGMDAGSASPDTSPEDNAAPGPADADEDTAEDDDDDPSNDEDTTCSICLINRQGPCRKHWLKFERCMKEHSAAQAKAEAKQKAQEKANEIKEAEGGVVATSAATGVDAGAMEEEWDAFMVKSIQPGEDDDDDDDDDEDDDDEDEEEEDGEGDESEESAESSEEGAAEPAKEEVSLAERCDRFMIPWIGCIQEHRNVYSLISNAFYQKDYIDPLEDTIPDGRRAPFAPSKSAATVGDTDGYLLKFDGVEFDLGNWREHLEADLEGNGAFEEEEEEKPPTEEPHLINAYAKFRLTDPNSGRPIEVAYVKDQKGRLLGFDSFTKRDDGAGDDGMHDKGAGADATISPAAAASNDGECTFHIVPGETTSVTAYAIYRGMAEGAEGSVREDFLYRTHDVRLPGVGDQEEKNE